MSLAFFAGSLILAGVGCLIDDRGTAAQFWYYGALLLVVSLGFQHTSRTFLIDPDAGTIRIKERRFMFSTWRRDLPMAGIRVRTGSVGSGGSAYYWIWLEHEGQPRILFLGDLRDQRIQQELAVRLREDLRCPGTSALPPER